MGSERTLWLRDVFGNPNPSTSPELSGRVSDMVGSDATRGPSQGNGTPVDGRDVRTRPAARRSARTS